MTHPPSVYYCVLFTNFFHTSVIIRGIFPPFISTPVWILFAPFVFLFNYCLKRAADLHTLKSVLAGPCSEEEICSWKVTAADETRPRMPEGCQESSASLFSIWTWEFYQSVALLNTLQSTPCSHFLLYCSCKFSWVGLPGDKTGDKHLLSISSSTSVCVFSYTLNNLAYEFQTLYAERNMASAMEPVLFSDRTAKPRQTCVVKTSLVGSRQRLIFQAQMAEWLPPPKGCPQMKGRFLFLIYANALLCGASQRLSALCQTPQIPGALGDAKALPHLELR